MPGKYPSTRKPDGRILCRECQEAYRGRKDLIRNQSQFRHVSPVCDAMCGGKMSDVYSVAKAVEGLGISTGTVGLRAFAISTPKFRTSK